VIVKLEDRYIIWSTIVDAPITFGMTLEELTEYVRDESGRRGIEELKSRLERVELRGTSSMLDRSAVDTVWLNRAGAGETCMSVEQLTEYFVRKRDPDAPLPRGDNEPPRYPCQGKDDKS